jgi:hypothetical protein
MYVKFGAMANAREWYRQSWGTARRWIGGAERGERALVPLKVRGVAVPAALGETAEEAALYKGMVSGRGVWRNLIQKEAELFNEVPTFFTRKNKGPTGQVPPGSSWGTVAPTDAQHLQAMTHVLNNHFGGGDAMMRRLLEGQSDTEIVRWLRSSEARDYTRQIPLRMQNPEKWVATARAELDNLVGDSDDLRRLMIDEKVSPADIERAMPEPATRPYVNGPITEQLSGRSQVVQLIQKGIDTWFRTIFAMPDDVLTRQPTMRRFYSAEMTRLVDLSLDQGVTLTDNLMQSFVKRARNKAIEESKRLLYDLSDQSRAAELMKFTMPFFEPMREQITVYAQLAREAPQRLARVYALLRSPARAGFLYDEKGNVIGPDGKHRDPNTDEEVAESQKGTRDLIRVPLPGWAREVADAVPFFTGALGGKQSFTIDRHSIRVGFPTELGGFGPIVQIPVNEVVKNKPAFEESFKAVLPFGVNQDSLIRQLMPAYLKQADSAEDNRTYAGIEVRTYFDKLTEFREDTGRMPTEDEKQQMIRESIDETNNFWHLRSFVRFTTPFSVGFDSPYKPYADAYRAAQSLLADNPDALPDEDGNARTADEWFLDTYGGEYNAMTKSVTRTLNGVPATVTSDAEAQRMGDLIEKYPSFGRLIVGEEGSGEWSRAVYLAHLERPLRPGTSQKWREPYELQGAKDVPEVDEGWQRYLAGMDIIDARMQERGLANLSSAAAAPLKAQKDKFVAQLEQEFPAWARSRQEFDAGKWGDRIDALTAISQDPRLSQRPEMEMLGTYLEGRRIMAGKLAKRKAAGGSGTLTAQSNYDLKMKWEDYGNKLAQEDLAFADIYHRYLESDPVVD